MKKINNKTIDKIRTGSKIIGKDGGTLWYEGIVTGRRDRDSDVEFFLENVRWKMGSEDDWTVIGLDEINFDKTARYGNWYYEIGSKIREHIEKNYHV